MDLKELLGEELYSQVVDKLGDKKLMVDDGNFIPKHRFDEVNNQKKELKAEVDKLNNTLKESETAMADLKKSAEGNADLQLKLKEYEEQIKSAQNDFGAQLTAKEQEWAQRDVENRKAFAMREKLLLEHADPKYIDLLMKEVDLEKISVDGESFIGIDDVVTGVKTSFEKLFGKPVVTGTGIGGGTSTPSNKNLEDLKAKAKTGDKQARLEFMRAQKEAQQE